MRILSIVFVPQFDALHSARKQSPEHDRALRRY